MKLQSKKEELIYNNVGGDERGKKAILAYREYIQAYNEEMSRDMRTKARERYLPRNEKSKGTNSIMHDEYE